MKITISLYWTICATAAGISLCRVEAITGKSIDFHQVDLLDPQGLKSLFTAHKDIEAVIHFAGLKAVGESVEKPLAYYSNNITGTLNLLAAMTEAGVKAIVFLLLGHGVRESGQPAH